MRIVNALNAHTDVRARLIVASPDHYGARVFEGDLSWLDDRDEAMGEIEAADVLHLHRFMDFSEKPFGLDFEDLHKRGKALIRQFHANPNVMANRFDWPVSHIVDDPVPQLVIGQFHERFYPRARVVPNIVPVDDERYTPLVGSADSVTIFFAPSETTRSAWDSRWETKAYPETQKMLQKLASRYRQVEVDIRTETPFAECLQARRRSQISIDELATGSYHLSSLESLAQGIPTLAYLDHRTQWTVRSLTGATELPWINVHLDAAPGILESLIEDSELRAALGAYSREWMIKYWRDRDMVQHYVRAYSDLLENPDRFTKTRFDAASPAEMWKVQGHDDAIWDAHRSHSRGAGRARKRLGV